MAAAMPPASPPITTSRSAMGWQATGGCMRDFPHGRAGGLSPLLHAHDALRRCGPALPGGDGRGGAVRLPGALPLLRVAVDHRCRLAALRPPRGRAPARLTHPHFLRCSVLVFRSEHLKNLALALLEMFCAGLLVSASQERRRRRMTWALAAPHTRPGSWTDGSRSAKDAGPRS